MSIAYDGPAAITLSAIFDGLEPASTVNDDVPVQLREDESLALVTVHFTEPVKGPDHANRVSITLPGGLTFAGPLIQGFRDGNVGWLRFQVETP